MLGDALLEGDELEGGLVEDELLGIGVELDEDGFGGVELDSAELDDVGVGANDDDGDGGFACEDDGGAGEDEGGAGEDEGGAGEDEGGAGEDEGGGGEELLEGLALLGELPPEFLPSNTTKLALLPFGTVTTQKLAPPTPMVPPADISFTLCFEGSMAQGRPLQPPPSQTISTPQVGILSRKGVAGSR